MKAKMRDVLLEFWAQVRDANKLSWDFEVPRLLKPSNIMICGMGGSAIGGDLLASLVRDEIKIPVLVNRGYEVPIFVNEDSLVFISTYSGNTEETLSAYEEAKKRTQNIVCITSGGRLEELKPRYILKIPGGYQPRCALGWLFVPMMVVLQRFGLIGDKSKDLEESVSLISELGKEFSKENTELVDRATTKFVPTLSPYRVAKKLVGKLPILYSDSRFGAVAKRWGSQLNENSKQFAHCNVFSELNHNEIVGFGEPKMHSLVVILRDRDYNSRIKRRIELSKRIFEPYAEIEEVEARGKSLLARFFYLIYFGDWVSYWLAIIKGVEPTPIERIDWLKKELAK